MFARLSRYHENSTDEVEEVVRQMEEKILPQAQALPGFVGLEYLLNRETGDAASITYWDSEASMRGSEQEASRIREESTEMSGGEIIDVERYEVVLRVGL